MSTGDFLGDIISEVMKVEELASVPAAASGPATRSRPHVQQVAKKLTKVQQSDPKLFALVMKELNKLAV